MNAQQVAERSAVYALEDAVAPVVGEVFDLLATAPQGVAKLRALILDLAVHGQLLRQNATDEPAAALLRRIHRRSNRREAVFDISEVPAGWIRTAFQEIANDLCTGPFGSLIGKSDYIAGGVPLINPSHLSDGRIVADERVSVSPSKARALGAYALAAGDIVFARRGDVGRNAVVSDDQDGWLCGTGSFFARFDSELCRPFLHIVFDSPSMRRYLCGSAIGSTMVNLNQKVLMRAPIPLPPLAEQRRIVARVEELMGLCDELETRGRLQDEQHARLVATLFDALVDSASPEELADNWQRIARHFDLLLDRPAAVDALEQTILQLAVRGLLVPQDPSDEPASALLTRNSSKERATDIHGLHVLPDGWQWTTVEGVASVGTGTTPSRTNPAYFSPASIPWVTSGETGRPFIDKTEQGVSPLALRDTSLKVYPSGTLIVAMYGQGKTRGQVSELRIEATTNQACAAIVPTIADVAHRRYLKLFFEKIYDEIRELSAGGAQPNLNVGKVKSTLVPLPPLAEQRRIVARVKELRGLCAGLRQHLQQSQATQSNLADALVATAMHGSASE